MSTLGIVVRQILRETLETGHVLDDFVPPERQDELYESGWTVVRIQASEIRSALRSVKSAGLHAATHNDVGAYALLISKKKIKSVAGACQKITKSMLLNRSCSVKTLSFRF